MTQETAAVETAAPQTAPAAAPAPQGQNDGKVGENEPGKNPKNAARKSLRETVKAAAAEVAQREAAPVSETESAARVLRGESEYPEQKTAAKPDQQAKPQPAAKTESNTDPKPAEPSGQGKEPAPGQVRDPATGQFQSKESVAPAPEGESKPAEAVKTSAPSRFSKEAQAEWANTPETVRGEVERALGELENGFRQYKGKADKYAALERFEALGQRYGMSLDQVLADYAGMSDMMQQGKAMDVFQALAQRHGVQLTELAAQVLDEELDDFVSRTGSQMSELQKENAGLKQQLAAANKQLQGFTNQKREAVLQNVSQFAEAHPRFEELFPTIKWILATDGVDKSDPQKALSDAYEMAERLKPAPAITPQADAQPAQPAAQPKPDLTAQTGVAQKSVHGFPGQGSNPTVRKPASSVREALKTAAGRTGLA